MDGRTAYPKQVEEYINDANQHMGYISKEEFYNKQYQIDEEFQRRQELEDQQQIGSDNNAQYNLFREHLDRAMIAQTATEDFYKRFNNKDPSIPELNPHNHLSAFNFHNPHRTQEIDLQKEFEETGIPKIYGNSLKLNNIQAAKRGSNISSTPKAVVGKPEFMRSHYHMFNPEYQQYQNNLNGGHPDPELEKLKDNIELLGGIEDCVGKMQKGLNDNEIKQLNQNYIHYYTYHNKQREEFLKQQQQQTVQQNLNPFDQHPKNLLENVHIQTKQDFRSQQQATNYYQQQQEEEQLYQQRVEEQRQEQDQRDLIDQFKEKRIQYQEQLKNFQRIQGK